MPVTQDIQEVGVVKMQSSKGFGFIRLSMSEDGTQRADVFFHAEHCNNRFDELRPGTRVRFRYGNDRRGRPQATIVEPTE